MKKYIKWTGIVLSLLLLLAVAGVGLIVTCVSPNSFKPMMIDAVKRSTGRTLTMDGDLSWTFFPVLGIKAGHLALSNPPGYTQKTFAEIEQARMGVKLLPLLHSTVESSGITLTGLKLNLVKKSSGLNNWQDLERHSSAANSNAKTVTMAFAIAGMDVEHAAISLYDEKNDQTYSLNDVEMHAKNISLDKAFPVSMNLHFEQAHPKLTGTFNLSGSLQLNLAEQKYQLNQFYFVSNLQNEGTSIDSHATGDAVLDLNDQTLRVNQWTQHIANAALVGNILVSHIMTDPAASGHVQVQPFDLKEWLQMIGQKTDNIQSIDKIQGDVNFTTGPGFNSMNVQGQFTTAALKINNVAMSNLKINTEFDNGFLKIKPMTADLYQGTLEGQGEVNFNAETPRVTLQGKLQNVQAQPLLHDLNGDTKLAVGGSANVTWDLTTNGSDSEALIKNLSGTSYMTFENGSLQGIDIGNMIDSAYAVVAKQKSPPTSKGVTNFGRLTATAQIQNGVIHNTDLLLDSPRFDTKGAGSIDLVNQKVNYQLSSVVKKDFQQKVSQTINLQGLVIPILITGSLDDPSVRVDTSVLLKAFADQQIANIEKKSKQKILDRLQDKQLQEKLSKKAKSVLKNMLGKN